VVHGLKALVFAGFGGTLSFQVIKWCELQGVGLSTLGWYGDFVGVTGTHLSRAQFQANPIYVGREILAQKLLSSALNVRAPS
jgi:hypothetical protein